MMTKKPPAATEAWLLRAAISALLPILIIALSLLWFGDFEIKIQITLTVVIFIAVLWFPIYLNEKIVFALRSVSNLLVSLREEDYNTRLNEDGLQASGALGEVYAEVNQLRDTLWRERTGAAEAGALLEKVMASIDVAIFAVGPQGLLKLVNPKGAALLGKNREQLMGHPAQSLGLSECLQGPTPRIANIAFGGRSGRWEIRRAAFRDEGHAHHLIVLTDLTQPLRREELEAWRRLVRVLRHEMSNSLAPIQSFSQSLLWMLKQDPKPEDWESDCIEGLEVITERSAAISRMLTSYKGIAGLPLPNPKPVQVQSWLKRVIALETRLPIALQPGHPTTIQADPDQLDQLLLNLIKNAVDASLETGGSVSVTTRQHNGLLEVAIEDEGEGLAQTENLFVPFFTTKPEGSGIGLVLCRQIAEAHQGAIFLENRTDTKGCRAILELPLDFSDPEAHA